MSMHYTLAKSKIVRSVRSTTATIVCASNAAGGAYFTPNEVQQQRRDHVAASQTFNYIVKKPKLPAVYDEKEAHSNSGRYNDENYVGDSNNNKNDGSAKRKRIKKTADDFGRSSPTTSAFMKSTVPGSASCIDDLQLEDPEECERLEWSAAESLIRLNSKDKTRIRYNMLKPLKMAASEELRHPAIAAGVRLPFQVAASLQGKRNVRAASSHDCSNVIFYAPPAGGVSSKRHAPQPLHPSTTSPHPATGGAELVKQEAATSLYRERSVEETEAAHDLLSLSQSLPPLTPPCTVTILQSEGSQRPTAYHSSIIMHEISNASSPQSPPSTSSSSLSPLMRDPHSGTIIRVAQPASQLHLQSTQESTSKIRYISSSAFDSHTPPDNSSNCSPLTPPNSDHSSDIDIDMSCSSDSGQSSHQPSRSWGGEGPKDGGRPSASHASNAAAALKLGLNILDGRTKACKANNNNKDSDMRADTHKKKRGCYKCSECGKQYATSSNLSRHKQTHRSLDSHSAKKCHTCGKAYVSMPALAMHLLTHKLTHSCGVCGKLFSRPWLLQGHLRSHTGEKPYGCAHCGKAFADRSNLRAHMQTHSIDKNFECKRCHKMFALKSYLNKHLESACLKDGSTDGDADGGVYDSNDDHPNDAGDSSDENDDDDIVVA